MIDNIALSPLQVNVINYCINLDFTLKTIKKILKLQKKYKLNRSAENLLILAV